MATAAAGNDVAPPRPEDGGRYDAFVSYQRENLTAVQRVRDALGERGKRVWMDVDYENIPAGTHWEDRIRRGIEACNAFIFVISQGSTCSEACLGELADAVELHKLIIPVIHEYVQPAALPPALAQTQWIDLHTSADWDAGIDALVGALENDIEWRDQHTRYAGLAREWLDHDRDGSYLLRGSDLRNAEAWLTQEGGHRAQPTGEQRDYVITSRHASVRRQRVLIGGLSTGLVVALVLAVFALIQRASAIRETHAAQSQLRATRALILASTAANVATSRPDQSLLLALEANRLEPSLLQARAVMTSDLEAVREQGAQAILGPADPSQAIDASAYSPNGRLLATGGVDGLVRLYDLSRHTLVQTVADGPSRGSINALAFAPDGRALATASRDGKLRLFTVSHGLLALRATADANRASSASDLTSMSGEFGSGVEGVAFAPSGTTLATGSQDGVVRLFSIAHDRLALLRGVSAGDAYDSVTSVAFAPDGAAIAAGIGSGVVQLVDLSRGSLRLGSAIDGAPQLSGTPTAVVSVAFAHGGAFLAAGNEGGTVQLIRDSRGKLSLAGRPRQVIAAADQRLSGAVNAVAFSPTDTTLAAGASDGTVQLFERARGALRLDGAALVDGSTGGAVDAVAFAPVGTGLAVAGDDGIVRLFGAADGRLAGTPQLARSADGTQSVAFAPGGDLLAAGEAVDGKLHLFHVARGALTPAGTASADSRGDQNGTGVSAIAFAPDGTMLATNSGDGLVRLFTDAHGIPSLVATARVDGGDSGVAGVAFAAGGATLVASTGGAAVKLFSVLHDRLRLAGTADPMGANAEILSLASAPDSSELALYDGGEPVLARVSTHTVSVVGTVPADPGVGADEGVALASGGSMLAVAADKAALLYRVVHGHPTLLGSAPTSSGYTVAISADGTRLAVGRQDGGVELFAISNGKLSELADAPIADPIAGVAFSPDGTTLSVAAQAGTQLLDIVWPNDAYLRTLVCGLVWRNLSGSEWSSLAPPGLREPDTCSARSTRRRPSGQG